MPSGSATSASIRPEGFPVRVWLISLAGWMFDFYDLVLFSFLLIPIGKDLHLTQGEQALLLGVALGASGIGGIVFGYLSDLRGRRYVMTLTILIYSIGTGLTALSGGFWSLLCFRLLTGLGVGGEWAVGHALLAESTPARMRGRAAGLLQSGEPLGVGLAAIVGLVVAASIGWRAVFVMSSLSAVFAFIARRPGVAAVNDLQQATGVFHLVLLSAGRVAYLGAISISGNSCGDISPPGSLPSPAPCRACPLRAGPATG